MAIQQSPRVKKFSTQGIILGRTDFGEADRIIVFLTPDYGKVKAIAKGVRNSSSKLIGGLELFSTSNLSFIAGRKDINVLVSARLIKYYSNIVKDIQRTNAAYEALRLTNKATEDNPEESYFLLLQRTLAALDDHDIPLLLTNSWFKMQLLKLAGHTPNLATDTSAKKLKEKEQYNFDISRMAFSRADAGEYSSNNIKFLRLGFGDNSPKSLNRVKDSLRQIACTEQLIQAMLQTFIRI